MLKGKVSLLCFLVLLPIYFSPPAFADEINSLMADPNSDVPVAGGFVNGRKIYIRYCSVCHGTKGEGGMGPPLKGVFFNKGKDFIVGQVTNPKGAMPLMYPNPIDDKAIADLLAYLEKFR